ncbi:MAG TPA: Fur family transcriptional regulator [Solirubrobacterales bacterium]|nr:Fur family transcriptional regulator [Solirubrobacterales bacterium]
MTTPSQVPSPPAPRWIELAEAELRRAGHRASAPRTAVLELIASQDCVLTAHEIADELRRGGRRVGIATVYRTLELLEELRLVQRLDVGGGSARYEPALPDREHHHHHLVCDGCGRVTPFEDRGLERAIDSLARRLDYRVGDHDVILRGSCPACSPARAG